MKCWRYWIASATSRPRNNDWDTLSNNVIARLRSSQSNPQNMQHFSITKKSHYLLQLITALTAFTSLNVLAANPKDLDKLNELKNAQAIHLDLSNTDLRGYPFIPGKIDLQQANISHSNLSGVDLTKMNLSGADLSYADLSHAKLKQVNLAGANLEHANLTGAQLQQSNLAGANLSFANITAANLQESTLRGANMTCATFNLADLTKTNFSEAIISGATFVNTLATDVIGHESVVEGPVKCSG